ncbi:hypothetical protein VSDG_04885 [Cytospora chrysosperma]|uniref:SnoaL-like domain-containing protein n=1 Tax=Cytospora chrysosperma TaxID=252740 RepID=A0A423W3H9_CYTCH|nr:hypothetical protein VSDG_04885 [Valsa sordida]
MDVLRAVMQETIMAFVQNNTAAVKNKDVYLLSSVLSDNCAKITNAEYEAQMKMELQTMSDVVQNVTRTVVDAHQRVANVWIEKTVHTGDGSTSSVVYDLEFTQDGKQISQYIEFVDTFESVKV